MKKFMEMYNVSHETFNKLKAYQASLAQWQEKFNLVGPSTLEDSWNRHFEDSAQLLPFFPSDAKTYVDFGAGAGFPGMVLAIMQNEHNPKMKITLVDSVAKKTTYLNHVKELTQTNVEILTQRIEQLGDRKFDVVSARAVTSLDDLLKYASLISHKDSTLIFPKGKNFEEEVEKAKKTWNFYYKVYPSFVNDESVILVIKNLRKKKGA